jgi:hypothetical protein
MTNNLVPAGVAAMSREQLIDALRNGISTPADRAAVALLVGYNAGELLDESDLRECMTAPSNGAVRVYWRRVHADVTDGTYDDLGDTAEGVLLLACSIAKLLPHPRLHTLLANANREDALVIARAVSIALGVRSSDVAAVYRENEQNKTRIARLRAALSTDHNAGGMAAHVRLADGEPTDHDGRHLVAPARAIAVADVERILDGEVPPVAPAGWTHIEPGLDAEPEAPIVHRAVVLGGEHKGAEVTVRQPRPPVDPFELAEHVVGVMRVAQTATTAQVVARLRERHGYETDRIAVTSALGIVAANPSDRFGGHVEQDEPHGAYRWVASS